MKIMNRFSYFVIIQTALELDLFTRYHLGCVGEARPYKLEWTAERYP